MTWQGTSQVGSSARRSPEAAADDFGVHLVHRTGAPPIRLTGRRVYHLTGDGTHARSFVSLWDMRSPGFILAHSCPNQPKAARTARKIDTLECAIHSLAYYCETLASSPIDWSGTRPMAAWDMALNAMALHGRVQAFQTLAGQAIADWHDWLDEAPPSFSTA